MIWGVNFISGGKEWDVKTNKPAASMTPTHVKVDCIFITSQEPTQITTQKLSVS